MPPSTHREGSTKTMYPDERPSVAEKSPKTSSRDLPPSRKSQAIQPVSPPWSKVSLHKFIYTLTLILLLVGAFYGYQMVEHKRRVGGWWNLLIGKSPTSVYNQGHGPEVGGEWAGQHKSCNPSDSTVEDRINALAEAFGMPSSDLARAIAVAVRHHVPPASLSSIIAKETGEAVRILTNDDETEGGKQAGQVTKESPGSAGIFGVGVENFVGMDDGVAF